MIVSLRQFPALLIFLLFISGVQIEFLDASEASVSCKKISVTQNEIHYYLEGNSQQKLDLVELAPYETYEADKKYQPAWSGKPSDNLQLTFSRFDNKRDRLVSHWQLVDSDTGKPIGPSRYVSDFQSLPSGKAKFLWNKSIKGLQCIVGIDDAIELKVKHATRNLNIMQVIDLSGKSKTFHTIDGQKVPININIIRSLDHDFKKMTDAGMNITIILLNPIPTQPDPNNPFIHPSSNLKEAPNHLGAFNFSNKKGVLYYRAAMEFLAKRYSRADAKYGLVSSYIIGNELQSHWWWHNIGEVQPEVIIREYAKALRLAYNSVRNYHDEIRIYASLDHHWTAAIIPNRKRALPGKFFLDEMNQWILKQGNFNWSLAHHPYPENLFEPRTWNDKQPTLDFNTPKITFKNLEVLTAYLSQPHYLINGKKRRIILSEQGFHKPDGPDGEKIQAAAYAYAYYRTSQLPEIDAFILHRHIDHAHEGGLKLGIREFKEGTVTTPGKKRFLFEIFQNADSKNWQDVFEFALPVIGIKNWKEINPVPVKP